MGFERYVDYALDVPMYFVKRGDTLHRRRRQVVSRSHGRQARRTAGRARRPFPTGPIISARFFPRCGSSVISKCAAPTAARAGASPRCPRSGSVCSTMTTPSTPPGIWSRTGPPRSASKLRDDVPKLGFKATIRDRSTDARARRRCELSHARPGPPQAASTPTAATRPVICVRSRSNVGAASPRRRTCWRAITAPGAARASRSMPNMPIRLPCAERSSRPWPRARPRRRVEQGRHRLHPA